MSHPKNIAFVLVPGSFSPTSFYSKVVPLLEVAGFEAYVVSLPSVDETRSSPAAMAEDAAAIHEKILLLVAEGKEVVLAAHSYGGFPATEATKNLSKSSLKKAGKEGGITALIYLTAFIPQKGQSLRGLFGDGVPDSIKNAGDYMYLDPPNDYKNIFNDFSEEEGKHLMSMMPNHSTVSFKGELTYEGWRDIPVTYLVTEMDLTIPPEMQRGMIEMVKGQGAQVEVESVESGHVPMLSVTEKVVGVLVGAAERGAKV